MLLENWLYTGILRIKSVYCPPLKKNINCDYLVIGGGFAGLHTALRLVDSGKKVVLLEKGICGSGSSGKSAGILTPNSEEDLNNIIGKYGSEEAKKIIMMPHKGIKLIVDTIKKYKLDCDFKKQDSLYLALNKSDEKVLKTEADTLKRFGFNFTS